MDVNSEEFRKELERCFDGHGAAALIHIAPLEKMLQDDPDRAIGMIFKVYNKALDEAYTKDDGENIRAFIESEAGGPMETIPHAIYNAVGAVYPYLEREQRDRALRQVLNILDKQNYIIVQDVHTPGIREPLLLTDIVITRSLYWPGLDEGKRVIGEYPLFTGFRFEVMDADGRFKKDKVQSDFVVAYSLLRSDMCNYGEDYVNVANPSFLGRVLKGAVAMRFAGVSEDDIKKGESRLRELLPKSVHHRIEPLREEGDWADWRKFRF